MIMASSSWQIAIGIMFPSCNSKRQKATVIPAAKSSPPRHKNLQERPRISCDPNLFLSLCSLQLAQATPARHRLFDKRSHSHGRRRKLSSTRRIAISRRSQTPSRFHVDHAAPTHRRARTVPRQSFHGNP
jgi:hypothetical protein